MKAWWQDRNALQRFVSNLIAAELGRLRPGLSAVMPTSVWHDTRKLDESDLGADSLERLRLATALTEALGLPQSVEDDRLLTASTFGEWLDAARSHLTVGIADLGFRSSGSVGMAKPCAHALAGLEEEARFLTTLFPERRRILAAVPAHHIYGFLLTILLPQAAGGIPVLDLHTDAPAAVAARWRPGDLIVGYPDFWREALRSSRFAAEDVVGVTSTAPCPAEVMIAATGAGLQLVEIFGSTETAGMGWRADPDDAFRWFPYWSWNGGGTISRTLTDGTVLSAPLQDLLDRVGDEAFRTLGRRDDVVQVGGVNVSLTEVRDVLLDHPSVTEAAIRLMRPDEGSRLKAFVVPTADAPSAMTLSGLLMTWAESVLPPSHRPRAFTFGQALPRTLLGKSADWNIGASRRRDADDRCSGGRKHE